jgi:signal transduction histidine kinase
MKGLTARGSLFRKYAAVLILLVGGVLLLDSLINLYFSYQETKKALIRLERQQAQAAATRIEQFVTGIERQVRAAMEVPFTDAAMAREQREIDFLSLLRDVPAITEIVQLDAEGRLQLLVSRFAPHEIGSQRDLSRDARFTRTRIGRTYFGPVYFRNESEPHLTIAVPWGEGAPEVAAAEVSLKAIRDVIAQIQVGTSGYAYVVDQRGLLVAHPDMSLVLQKRDLAALPQVRAARAVPAAQDVVSETAGLKGGQALTSHAAIERLGWLVFVEQPIAEALAPLEGEIVRSVIFLVVGLGLSVLASLMLARRMVAPIRLLQQGAARIGAGELGHRLDVRTGDELEALGEEFNRTAARLEESYATLEEKVETRTRELADANAGLTEALEQQTATAEILRVISSSPTDVQPVFDAIVESAVRLCGAQYGAVYSLDGELVHLVAHYNLSDAFLRDLRAEYPMRPTRTRLSGRVILSGSVAQIPDVTLDPDVVNAPAAAREGFRSLLGVPIIRSGVPIGTIVIYRPEAGSFPDKHIGLLKTFADQAIIAIENVRLFRELESRTRDLGRSVEELQALGEVGRAVSATLDLETVLNTIVARAVQLASADGGVIYEYDETSEEFSRISGAYRLDEDLGAVLRGRPLRLGEGATGRAAVRRAPVQVPDVLLEGAYDVARVRAIFERRGYRALLAVPLLLEQRILGVLVAWRQEPGTFGAEIVNRLQAFAGHSVLALRNAQLYRELEEKGRQLETASRHKSEFLANMSHELRTPLNAILGFNEMILGQIYGDVPVSMKEPLTDIQNSGKHLLRLINNVLDLSKIEAGRMELSPVEYAVPDLVERVRASLYPLAAEKGLEFVASVPDHLPLAYGDAGRITQCLMNLAGNALKFTRQGRVGLSVDLQDGFLVYRVADTGIGIAKDKIDSLFTEFRQGDATITTEFGGTGLGLSITKKFVEMHGGRVWVESELGKGSTFSVSIPLRLAGDRTP